MECKINYMVRRETFEGWQISPRYIKDYELVFVIEGLGNITVGERSIPVCAGDLVCFRPNVKHSLYLDKKPYMTFYALHFQISDEELLSGIPDHIHITDSHWLEVLIKGLYDEYRNKGYLCEWKREIALQRLLCEILSQLHVEQTPIESKRIGQVLEYIHEDPFREYSLDMLMIRSNIKKTLFLQSFRKITGTTPTQYIIALRLEIACELLIETDLSISDISQRCGFSDPFYFSRCFKKRYSISPKGYRNTKKCD